jgi:tetratricopeptide (TPR) repeat protein
MSRRPDDALFDAISGGGFIMNRSNLMPARTAGGVVVAVAVAVAAWLLFGRGSGPVTFPAAPAVAHASAGPVYEDFVGSQACADCHAAEFAAWSVSTHSKAGGAPTRERIIGPFDGRALRFRDAVVTPSQNARGAFIFTVAQQNRPARTFEVHAVVGGGFMEGGGTQAYFSKFPDGTVRFLPFDYSRSARRFFCNTLGRANRGWVPISPEIALADCGDWPPTRILGSTERFQTCQQCHGSQIEVSLDSTTRGYRTRYPTLGINCESCHGPGRRHIELARSGGSAQGTDIGMRALATLTKGQSLGVCFQCHAAKTALEPQYLPGKPLLEHFALKLPVLLDTIYFPDGRTRSFGYQEGHLASDCYLNGSMTCVDCHDPHTQRYRDVNAKPLVGRFSDGQCTACHASKAERPERHSHHAPNSAGTRCVACHMPYLQQPNVGQRIRYARSDHVIPIPRPLHDTRMGVETACRQCHRERSPQQLEADVRSWWGELKPLPQAVAGALAADSLRDVTSAARALLGSTTPHPIAAITGLADFLQRFVRPDAAGFDATTTTGLERTARDSDPDIQALALAALHLGKGNDPAVRRFLAGQLRALGDRDRLVRDRWVWVLVVRGDAFLARGDLQDAMATYRKAGELAPDDPTVLRRLGVAFSRIRDYSSAIDLFRRSLAQSSDQPQVLLELGFALMQRGDLDSAEAVYRDAIARSPLEPGGYANIALVQLRRGETAPAIAALNEALRIDPGLVDAYLLLGRTYATLGRTADAATALRRALEFSPGNAAAQRMLDALPR